MASAVRTPRVVAVLAVLLSLALVNAVDVSDSSMTGAAATGGAGGGTGGAGAEFGPCRTCVFVLERIKKGTNMLLPAICSDIYTKFPDAYSYCHQTLNALALNGNNVRYWLFEGCYKFEVYNSKEWIKPCPSHVMCSVLKDLRDQPFCTPMAMEDPFAAGGSSGAGTGGAAASGGARP